LAIFQLILTKFRIYIVTNNVLGNDGTPLFSTSGLVVIRLMQKTKLVSKIGVWLVYSHSSCLVWSCTLYRSNS